MDQFDDDINLTAISDEPTSHSSSTLSQSQFFSLIENALSTSPIVDFFNGNEGRQRRKEAESHVGKLNKVKCRRLFAALLPLLSRTVEEECYAYNQEEGEETKGDDEFDEASAVRGLQFLKLAADWLTAHVGTIKKTAMDEVFEMATLLHDSLFVLHQCSADGEGGTNGSKLVAKHAAAASASIFLLCEKWWHMKLEDREQLVTQLIPLLLLASLDEKASKADVKRLYSMREAFDLLDFADPSIASLQSQLLRTLSHPLFLQCSEGKKFLSHLFTLPELTGSLHAVVKVQILSKKSILGCYGEVYWGAWKSLAVGEGNRARSSSFDEDDEEVEDEREVAMKSLEENALQPLAYMTIHASNPTVAKNCRLILDKFLLYKKDPEVESTLYRLYGPILWRSCNAANAKVRMQAAVVLGDTFPLKDGSSVNTSVGSKAKMGYEDVVTKSVQTIVKLMRDEVPHVRVQGCICAGRVLEGFWVAIPSSDIRALLNEIVAKHASDTSSAAVRTTAIQTVTSLLAEYKTHAVIRPLLPSMGNLIHDKTEKVRLAVVHMLLVVKKLRGMKYYHVVPATHLLARLADEGRGRNNPAGPVAQGLTGLLCNSFFPTGSKNTMADVISRTFRLIQDDPSAALVFYRNASTQLSVNSIVKLITALMKCLCLLIVEEKKGMSEDVTGLDLSVVAEEGGLGASDGGIVGGSRMTIICESISVLWESIQNDLKDNGDFNELLLEAFNGNIITEIFCHFEAKCNNSSLESSTWNECFRAIVSILHCAGNLNADTTGGLREKIVTELEQSWDLPVEQRCRANFSPHTSLLVAWGMHKEVATCISFSISNYFEGGDKQHRKKKARCKKEYLPALNIDVALNILGQTLYAAHPSLAAARDLLLNCDSGYNDIVSALEKAQAVASGILRPIGSSSTEVSDELIRNIGRCIECHGKLLLHKACKIKEMTTNLSEEATLLINWISEDVVHSLTKLVGQDNTLRELDISGISGIDSPIKSPDAITRRDGSRNSSFPRMSLGLSHSSAVRSSINVYQDSNTIRIAVTSMKAVLIVISSWLSICRSKLSQESVINSILNWFSVIKCPDESVRMVLLPLFSRIALQCLSNGESLLFDEVLACVEDAEWADDDKQSFALILCGSLMLLQDDAFKSGVSCIVRKIRSNTSRHDLNDDNQDICMTILEKLSPVIRFMFMKLIDDNRGCVILSQLIIGDTSILGRTDLIKQILSHATKSKRLDEVLKEWDASLVEEADNLG